MQVTKLNWGLSHWLTDDLQIDLFPHMWLPTKKGKTIKIEQLLPNSLITDYTYAHGVLKHNDY